MYMYTLFVPYSSPILLFHQLFFFFGCKHHRIACTHCLYVHTSYSLLISHQSDFHPNRSIRTILVKVTDDLYAAKSIRYLFYFIHLKTKKTKKE